MIFVTVGTHRTFAFDRLVKPMDLLAAGLDEPVIIQHGCSTFEPRCAQGFRFTNSEHMEQLMADARVIVSHVGAGTVIEALCQRKPLVLVPRQLVFQEIVDNHQMQLATALAAQKLAMVVYEPSVATLREAIQQTTLLTKGRQQSSDLPRFLQHQLRMWEDKAPRDKVPQTQRV